jgi:hypothetical protein
MRLCSSAVIRPASSPAFGGVAAVSKTRGLHHVVGIEPGTIPRME